MGASWGDHRQCWGVIMSTAPWSANILLYLAKIISASDSGGCHQEKETGFLAVFYGTGLCFVIFNGFFAATNLIPASVIYIWFLAIILGFFFITYYLYAMTIPKT